MKPMEGRWRRMRGGGWYALSKRDAEGDMIKLTRKLTTGHSYLKLRRQFCAFKSVIQGAIEYLGSCRTPSQTGVAKGVFQPFGWPT
jgi:hypothetical protein